MKRMLTGRSSGLFAALLTACCVTVAQAATAGTKSAARTAAVKPAVLTVKAQPQPAQVFLDSVDLGFAPVTISQGDTLVHQIRVEARWHRPWLLPVKFDPRIDREINATLRRQEGALKIATQPAGATVRINGKMVGYAPQTLDAQPAGIYDVSAELAGYLPATTTLTVDDQQVAIWNPVLQIKVGQISISGWPAGATISCRQQRIGTIPMVWENLKPGRYKVEVERPGFEPATVQFLIDPNTPASVDIRLRPTTAFKAMLRSMVLPGNGQIYRGHNVKGLTFEGAWCILLGAAAAALNDRTDRYNSLDEDSKAYYETDHDFEQYYQQVARDYKVRR